LEKSIKELSIFIQKDKLVIAEKLLLGKFEVDWTITLLSYLFSIVYLTILLIVSTGLKDRK
jgi:hypothetical protein